MGNQLVFTGILHRRKTKKNSVISLGAGKLGVPHRLLRLANGAGDEDRLGAMSRGFLGRNREHRFK